MEVFICENVKIVEMMKWWKLRLAHDSHDSHDSVCGSSIRVLYVSFILFILASSITLPTSGANQLPSSVQFQSNPVKYSPPHTTKMREQTGEWVDASVNDNRKCGNLRFIHLTPTSTTQQNKKVIWKREQLTANKQLKTFLIQCRPFCFVLFCIVVLR